LERSGDGGASSVSAILQNPVQTVTIVPGATTPIAFDFVLQNLGSVTFGTGSASVVIGTSSAASSAPPTTGAIAGSFGPTNYQDYSGGTMPALTSLLSTPVTAQYNLALQSLSPFTPDFYDEVCATFVPSFTTAAGTPVAIQDLFTGELNSGATGTICFADPNASLAGIAGNTVAIYVSRSGPALTPTFQTALSNGADAGVPSAGFFFVLTAPTDPVYNGSTANFGPFSSPVTLTSNDTFVEFTPDPVQNPVYGFLSSASITLTLSLSP
jgi:hypothetical protein